MTTETRFAEEQDAREAILDAYAELCPGIIGNPYLAGHFPLPMQWMFLRGHLDYPLEHSEVFQALYGGAAGGGKMLCLGTMIPTPRGFVPLSALRPGDEIFGRDGRPYAILAESEIVKSPAYRLTFDDGTEIVAHDDHLWLTLDAADLDALTKRSEEFREARRERRPSRALGNKSKAFTTAIAQRNRACAADQRKSAPAGRVRTTAEIVATLRTQRGRSNHAIPVAAPLQMPNAVLPLDPYVLGVWLGDGTSAAGSVTTMDSCIVQAVVAAGFPQGNVSRKPNNRAATYGFNGLRQVLRGLGVFGNKHVPEAYLWASESQRLALLQGLLDTDGTVGHSGSAEFTSCTQALAESVAHLARSLGHKARVREGVAKLNGRVVGPRWDVKFTASMPVFRLARKAARLRLATRRTTQFRYVVRAERVKALEMKCIKVASPDHLYLAGRGLVPTHNSDALLMAVAQHVDQPEYAGLIFRRTFTDLALPGAIMDRARDWWANAPGVAWDGTSKTFRFASGAKVSFAYLQNVGDELRYQGAEFQCICWDELTQFPDRRSYRYLLSRIRRPTTSKVPLRALSASNPGGPGHSWVAADFDVEIDGKGFPFYPARVVDNPYIDRDAYIAGLMHLHPTTRAQLLNGDWRAREPGDYFRREWFGPLLDPAVDLWPSRDCRRVRWWDLAASVKEGAAHTAGVKMARHVAGVYAIEHCASFQATPGMRDSRIVDIARSDGPSVTVGLEIEPGSGGPAQVESIAEKLKAYGIRCVYARPRSEHDAREKVYVVRAPSSENAKAARCDPVAACLERGYARRGEGDEWDAVTQDRVPWWGLDAGKPLVEQQDGIRLFAGDWTQAYLDIVEGFPGDGTARVDEADATSGAWAWLKSHPSGATKAPEHRKAETLSIDEIRRLNPAERPVSRPADKDRGGRWRP